ncbi:MAG: TonB-dependent receptor [Chitinophagaceae bacterium]|nr:TonB-dependent receptor [Chitinophagaceae bacterium]
MKRIIYILLTSLLIPAFSASAQNSIKPSGDTLIYLKVFGACEQCKDRIEGAVKGRGVRSAAWDENTNQLQLVYNPAKISLEKIKNKIVSVGHDLEDKKADDNVYNALPTCCLYRKPDSMSEDSNTKPDVLNLQSITAAVDSSLKTKPGVIESESVTVIKGVVLEEDNKGVFKPLPNASVFLLSTGYGVITDTDGIFSIHPEQADDRLVITYTGYKSDTIAAGKSREVRIILATDRKLKEVVITTKKRSTYVNNFNPIRTETLTSKEILKAACCNLSESFETNPSVDVSYNDAVTGSKQIQLLGLSGNYSQLTVENLPGPRGIATPLGLNSIAGPWIESIQLTKGVGSVANGYESIAGQINVELKKPENSEQMLANLYVNSAGKTDLNLNLSKKIGKNWSAGLLLHDDFLANRKMDFNKDGFRDLPTGNSFGLVNRYKYSDGKGLESQFGIKILHDKRTGGEVIFDPGADKNTTNSYGLGIEIQRYEAFGKIGYVFPGKKYKSVGLQIDGISHTQDSYFGLTNYNAKQKTVYANLIYQSIINTTIHKFRTGLSFLYDDYQEVFKTANFARTEMVPGIFGEYTFTPNDKFSAIVGMRLDHNSLFGLFITPRLNMRYEPVKGTVLRMSAGRGQRTANIFAENMSVFVSARQLNILGAGPGGAYGLDPEVAWNKGISVDQKFKLFNNDAQLSLDYFRNDFKNQVVIDLENAREVKFYNLSGKSYSNSFQAQVNVEPIRHLEMRLAYRLFDVKSTFSGQLIERPLISKHRAFANLAYEIRGFKLDYTITYNGRKRLPGTAANTPAYQLPDYSPTFITMNTQVSRTFGKKYPFDIYIGVENLTNYFQENVIVAAAQPFGQYFDASMVWGPVSGRMVYGGLRLTIK